MNVKVTSIFTDQTWEGEVDPALAANPHTTNGQLEFLFRHFNRVDDTDDARLEAMGFTQPSMSVGDRVELDGDVWYVHPVGFKRTKPTGIFTPEHFRTDQ